jgi:membrane glycosyltransferase
MWTKHSIQLFCLIYITIYVLLAVSFGLMISAWDTPQTLTFYIIFQFIFVGVAFEITEIIFAMVFSNEKVPQQHHLIEYPRAAILTVTCNDVNPAILELLHNQTYPNCDVFILDDSTDLHQRLLVDASGHRILRRETRRAFKAGNLNHWIDQFGKGYRYIAILDSDSIIDNDYLFRMLKYAEHPANKQIAIFQSKIHNWNSQSTFSRLVGVFAPVRMYVLERVYNRLNLVFSFGHNNLIRMDAVEKIGGFPEYISAEDSAQTLALNQLGYSVKVVDVVSYDSEPETVSQYIGRSVRWAKQTVEVFRFPWYGTSIRFKIALCFTVYFYIRPLAFLLLLMLSVWSAVGGTWQLNYPIAIYVPFTHWHMSAALFVLLLGIWLLQLLLYLVLVLQTKVRIRDYLYHSILSLSLAHLLALPILWGMVRAMTGATVHFSPTNARPTNMKIKNLTIQLLLVPSLVLAAILLTSQISEIPSVNSIWAIMIVVSALFLWYSQRNSRPAE